MTQRHSSRISAQQSSLAALQMAMSARLVKPQVVICRTRLSCTALHDASATRHFEPPISIHSGISIVKNMVQEQVQSFIQLIICMLAAGSQSGLVTGKRQLLAACALLMERLVSCLLSLTKGPFGAGDVTLKRGLESLERCWQSHAGPSNLVPSLQPRSSASGCLDLPPGSSCATSHDASILGEMPISDDTANQQAQSATESARSSPGQAGLQSAGDQASGQESAAFAASPNRLFMGNATLDRNLQSLQRRWDSQQSR